MGIELTPRARGIVGVRADSGNATRILAELQKTFEDFKAEREKEIADLKKGMKDVVQTEKVDRINAEVQAPGRTGPGERLARRTQGRR